MLNTLGDHIRKRRMELELSQSQLAECLKVQTDTIRNWERNRSKPRLRYRPAILQFLSYDPASTEPKTIGEKLLKYRRDRGMTQKDLAREMGIDPTTLSRLERGNGKRLFRVVLRKINAFMTNHFT